MANIVRPYGDTLDDGKVQLSFTLPVKNCGRAKEAARLYVQKLGFKKAEIVHAEALSEDFTFFVAYGKTDISLDYAGDIVKRGLRLEGVAGREIFRSWYKMESLLKSGAVNPRPDVTHRFAFKDFKKAFALINSKEKKCGKIILTP